MAQPILAVLRRPLTPPNPPLKIGPNNKANFPVVGGTEKIPSHLPVAYLPMNSGGVVCGLRLFPTIFSQPNNPRTKRSGHLQMGAPALGGNRNPAAPTGKRHPPIARQPTRRPSSFSNVVLAVRQQVDWPNSSAVRANRGEGSYGFPRLSSHGNAARSLWYTRPRRGQGYWLSSVLLYSVQSDAV